MRFNHAKRGGLNATEALIHTARRGLPFTLLFALLMISCAERIAPTQPEAREEEDALESAKKRLPRPFPVKA